MWNSCPPNMPKGREPTSAAALASQPAAGHSLSFYYYHHHYCFMTLWLRPISEAGRRKLQPNLAPTPNASCGS